MGLIVCIPFYINTSFIVIFYSPTQTLKTPTKTQINQPLHIWGYCCWILLPHREILISFIRKELFHLMRSSTGATGVANEPYSKHQNLILKYGKGKWTAQNSVRKDTQRVNMEECSPPINNLHLTKAETWSMKL